MRTSRGFTLIELLVVIAIIAILASIVLVSVNTARNKGKDARVLSDLQQIRSQLEADQNSSLYLDFGGTANASFNADQSNLSANAAQPNGQVTTFCQAAPTTGIYSNCQALAKLFYDIAANTGSSGYAHLFYKTGSSACPGQSSLTCMTQYAIVAQLNDGSYACTDSQGNSAAYKNAANMTISQPPVCSVYAQNG